MQGAKVSVTTDLSPQGLQIISSNNLNITTGFIVLREERGRREGEGGREGGRQREER